MRYEWLQTDLMHIFVLKQLFNIPTMSKLQSITTHPLIQPLSLAVFTHRNRKCFLSEKVKNAPRLTY